MIQQTRKTIFAISLVIIVGIVLISGFNYRNYSHIIKDDILNISKLTSTNIYSVIDNELTKPIFVSLTMANDQFVKNWLYNEAAHSDEEIVSYLNGIKEKYAYNSVFLVSDASKHYYHYNGLFKKITQVDIHDQWFYDFKASDETYILDVDQDEVDHQMLTIFINCKITDDEGDFIGVTGVGVEMDYVQELLSDFENTYNLEAFLVDENGLVQAHTNEKLIETRNIENEVIYQEIGDPLYDRQEDINVFHLKEDDGEQYVISHYIDELDWYLIVRKDTGVLSASFTRQVMIGIIISILVLLGVIGFVRKIIMHYQRETELLATTDTLTSLPNRRRFDYELDKVIHDLKDSYYLFVIDVDGFKNVNDTHGHLQGDQILKSITMSCRAVLGDILLSRWGGDEFAGMMNLPEAEAKALLESLISYVANQDIYKQFDITISAGMTKISEVDTVDSAIKRADRALYQSKMNGKNQLTTMN